MNDMPINPVDGLVVLAVLLSALLALFRGFVRELLSLISWTVAIILGAKFSSAFKPFFQHYTDNDAIAGALGGFVIFVLVLIVLTIVSHYIARSVRASAVSSVDRALGFLFGALRGLLVAALVYLAGTLIFTNEKTYPDWLTSARTEPLLRRSAHWLTEQMPPDLKQNLDKSLGGTKKDVEQAKQEATDKAKDKAADDAALDRLTHPQPGRVDGHDQPKADTIKPKADDKAKAR